MMLLLFGAMRLRAQVPEFPDTLSRQQVIARTERFSSTHTTSFFADYRLDQPFVAGIIRTYLQSSTSLFGSPATRDQIDAMFDLQYQLPSAMRMFVLGEGTLTNDVRNGTQLIDGLNNTAASFLAVGGRFVDGEGNRVGAAFGGAYNRQLNVEDAGGAVYGEAFAHADLGGYQAQLSSQGRWYNITPRHNSNAYVDLHVLRQYDSGSSADFQFRYDLINTDLYVKRPEELILQMGGLTYDGLQARSEGRLRLNSLFTYAADDNLIFDAMLGLASTSVRQEEMTDGLPPLPTLPDPYRYDRADLGINASVAAKWYLPLFYLNLRLEYSNSEQQNTVDATAAVSDVDLKKTRETSAQNDYVARQLLLTGTSELRFSRRDTLSASASVGIYRYDTPSPTNFFDKDEQSIQGGLRYSHAFSPMLSAALYGQVYLTHLVYLFGENSNDNNWNRVFRLAPSVWYSPGASFENFFEAEVLANYTQYDFDEETSATVRGRSFRSLRLRDSVRFGLTQTLRMAAHGDFQIAERGSFSWIRFTESLLERNRTDVADAELQSLGIEGMIFCVGGRISRVENFRTDPNDILEPYSDQTSIGPTARLELRISERSTVQFNGWWEHRFEGGVHVGTVPTLFMNVAMKL